LQPNLKKYKFTKRKVKTLKEIIDLYSRVIIGILGFVAPAITLLIGVFADGIDFHRKKKVDKVRHLMDLMQDSHDKIKGQPKEKANHLRQSIKRHDEQKSTLQKEINLLSPKRQVIRVFGSLILSLLFIVVYDILVIYHFPNGFLTIKSGVLLISLLSFTYSLYCLWQIFCIIIDLKHIDLAETLGKHKKEAINQGDFL
jgi:hypothetical protein